MNSVPIPTVICLLLCMLLCDTVFGVGEGTCSIGWSLFNGNCYITTLQVPHNEAAGDNFHEARAICKQMGGDLASIHSEEENRFVFGLTKPYGTVITFAGLDKQNFWIGLSTPSVPWTANQGKWTDGTPVDFANPGPIVGRGMSPYAISNPTYDNVNHKEEQCILMLGTTSGSEAGKWVDVPCVYKKTLEFGSKECWNL